MNLEGNFREILCYRFQGGNNFRSYLKGPGMIKYTIAKSQNTIMESYNKILLDKIVSRVNASKCFSILSDKKADVLEIKRVALYVRYVKLNNLKSHNEFLQFVPTANMTGKELVKLIIQIFKILTSIPSI